MSRSSLRFYTVLFVLAFLAGSAVRLYAAHQWGCYHWNKVDIKVANKAKSDYYNIYREETWTDPDAWDKGTGGVESDLNLIQVGAKQGPNIELLSGNFGFNGWLGLAQIWVSGCVITRGQTKLNNTYFTFYPYTRTNIKHVACQEVGHTFGLDHNRVATDTCMNDTILTAPQPNQHDFELVNQITP